MARRWSYVTRNDVDIAIRDLIASFQDPRSPTSLLTGAVRDERLLDSALALPRQPYYSTTMDKAAALLRSMIKNHPFVDGNKRIGVVVTSSFFEINGYELAATNDELLAFTLDLAASDPPTPLADVTRWLRAHTGRT